MYVFTEPLSIIPTGKVEVAVQMEVVGRELGHSHDGLLAVVSDLVNLVSLLCFSYQSFFQTCNDLALRVQVLRVKRNEDYTGNTGISCPKKEKTGALFEQD